MSIVIAALALPGLSATSAYAGPVEDFRNNGGQIDVCKYTPKQLLDAKRNLSPDVLQYAPGLADQLSAGQEGCGGSPSNTPEPRDSIPDAADTDRDGDVDGDDAAAGASRGGGNGKAGNGRGGAASRVPAAPAPATLARARLADIATPPVSARTRSDVPSWVIILLAALGLGALLFTLVRFGGLSTERFTAPLKASFADAGGRSADALSEFWDSVRLGR